VILAINSVTWVLYKMCTSLSQYIIVYLFPGWQWWPCGVHWIWRAHSGWYRVFRFECWLSARLSCSFYQSD
jgi:hypothetical protein